MTRATNGASVRTVARTRLALAVLLLVAVTAVLAPVGARTPDDQTATESMIQQARRAAALGAVEEAAEIYRSILREEPEHERAFWGLVSLYSSAGMDELLIPLLERRLSRNPYDMQAKMELGQAHARSGNHDLAHEIWMEVLAHGTADAGQYSEIGALEIRHRMFEHALRTFLTGRDVFRSETIFSQELTQVYTALGDYDSAVNECFRTVKQHRGAAPWATNRIELMLEEGADRRDIRSMMTAAARDENATTDELALAGSVFLVLDMPDRALETFLRADEISRSQGVDLLEYAAILKDDGRVEHAREAYLAVMERYPGTSGAARAGTSAARLLAEAGDPAGAVAELRAVSELAAGSARGAQALFEAARIELDVLRDPEAALATVAELRGKFGQKAREVNDEATLIEVDAHMRLGRLDAAYERSETLVRDDVPGVTRESAMFSLGFISFLKHDYDRSLEEFRVMVEANSASVLVNDALRLMLAIASAQEAGDTSPIDLLADAHASRLAGDRDLSEDLLLELADRRTGEPVETEALLLLGAYAASDDDPERAIAYYDRIITETEAITARAEAMMRKADTLRYAMGRKREAADQYLAILEDLPSNSLSGEARRKLDGLRRGEEAG